jgi:hypothetical protein
MTVRELVGLLTQYPPDLPVLVNGQETGFDPPHLETATLVRPAWVQKPWQGRYARHGTVRGLAFEALLIRRLVP